VLAIHAIVNDLRLGVTALRELLSRFLDLGHPILNAPLRVDLLCGATCRLDRSEQAFGTTVPA
jgi:hypothetical protein